MSGEDLFLSYHSPDGELVRELRQLLNARGISTFLASANLGAGRPWPQALEDGLRQARAVAVLVGPRGLGDWQKKEMYFALSLQEEAQRSGGTFPVIPVLLPEVKDPPTGLLFYNTWVDLREGIGDREALDSLVRALHSTDPAEPTRLAVSPYRGLRSFREEDAGLFHGRKEASKELLEKVLTHDLVALVGSSGSGKSSLAQAGLLPLLRRRRPPNAAWDAICFSPKARPFYSLAWALMPLLENELSETRRLSQAQELSDQFAKAQTQVEETLRRCLEKSGGTDRLLIIVDQFEELFTQAKETDRKPFVAALLEAQKRLPVSLLCTLRGDFYSRAMEMERDSNWSARLQAGQIYLNAMKREELRDALSKPADRMGLKFESDLIERILDDVGNEPGNLPLLEFALDVLWDKREDGKLTHAGYKEAGRVAGAIAVKADEFAGSLSAEKKAAVRSVFTRLVRISPPEEGGKSTRQRIPLDDLSLMEQEVAQGLAKERLLVIGREEDVETVSLAHEALIQHWPQLQDWLKEDSRFLLWRQRLRDRLAEWKEKGRDPSCLLTGSPLNEALRWLADRPRDLSPQEQEFVRESRANRKQRKLRIAAMVGLAVLIAAMIAWRVTLPERRRNKAQDLADQAGDLAESRPQTALLLAIEAQRLTALAGEPRFPPIEEALRKTLAGFGGRVLGRYDGRYRKLVASPDRSWVAAAGEDGQVRVWSLSLKDPASQERVLPLPEGKLEPLEFSPDNAWLLVGTDNRTLYLHGLKGGGRSGWIPIRNPDPIRLPTFSPRGRWLAIQPTDDDAQLWNPAASDAPPRILDSGRITASAFAFSPDERWLAAGGTDGRVRLWSLGGNGTQAISSPLRAGPIAALCFLPGTPWIVLADTSWKLARWNWETGALLEMGRIAAGIEREGLKLSPDGRWLAVWTPLSPQILVWDLSAAASPPQQFLYPEKTVTAVELAGDQPWLGYVGESQEVGMWNLSGWGFPLQASGPGRSIAFSRDSRWLVTGGDGPAVHLWELLGAVNTEDAMLLRGHEDSIQVLGFGTNGRWLLTSGSEGAAPRLWDLRRSNPAAPEEPLSFRGHFGSVGEAVFQKQGSRLRLITASAAGRFGFWDPGSEDPVASWADWSSPPGSMTAAAFSKDGRWAATAVGKDVSIWSLQEEPRRLRSPFPYERTISTLGLSPDGRWLAVGLGPTPGGDAKLFLQDLRSISQRPHQLRSHGKAINSLTFSPDRAWLLTAGGDGVARLWRLEPLDTTEPHRKFDRIGGQTTAAAFSYDAHWLALAGDDRIVRLWMRPSEQHPPDRLLQGHLERLLSLAFSRDGRWVAGGGEGGTVYLWDWEHHPTRPQALPRRHRSQVQSVAFDPESRWLMTGDAQGEIYRWDLSEERLLRFACETVGRNLTREEWDTYFPGEVYRKTCPASRSEP